MVFRIPEAGMGRNLAAADFVLQMNSPHQIIGKVSGMLEIRITETTAKQIGRNENAFFLYKGKARCGMDDLSFMEATIVAFNRSKHEDVELIHGRLSLFNHPSIMTSMGYGCGSKEHENYSFLAFPYFESTLAEYVDKSSKRTVEHNRFTEEFIRLIVCVVLGLLEFHNNGYYCPNLSAESIAVVKHNDHICAKLWNFCVVGNEDKKDMNWVRLGEVIEKAARNHKSYTPEIADLCEHMKNGTLKGMEITKQSALLSVRAKFDNIVALNTIALTCCNKLSQMPSAVPKANLCSASQQDSIIAMEQLYYNASDKNKTLASLQALLDSDVGWKTMIPEWISERIVELGLRLPNLDTFREFLWEIRCLYEHENKYNPPEAIEIISSHEIRYHDEKPDFESEVRKSWAYLFLIAQKFAVSLELESLDQAEAR